MVFPLNSWWCPPQETSQPLPPPSKITGFSEKGQTAEFHKNNDKGNVHLAGLGNLASKGNKPRHIAELSVGQNKNGGYWSFPWVGQCLQLCVAGVTIWKYTHQSIECTPNTLQSFSSKTHQTLHRLPVRICFYRFNSLWPSDATSLHISGSTFAQVMACCLTASTITWTNVDFSLARFCSIQLKAISQVAKLLLCIMGLKFIYSKLFPHLPGVNELKCAYVLPLPLSCCIQYHVVLYHRISEVYTPGAPFTNKV